MTKKKRLMLTIPEDIEADAALLKKEKYYDKPYSEMYRQLLRIGLDALKEEKKKKKGE